MKITLTSTDEIVEVDGHTARVWNGHTEGGDPCRAMIARLQLPAAVEACDLSEVAAPSLTPIALQVHAEDHHNRPIAYHCIMVECFADDTVRVRLENAELRYEGRVAVPVDSKSMVPRQGRASYAQAAADLEKAATMLATALLLEAN